MMYKRLFLLFNLCCVFISLHAQDLNTRVQILSPKVQSANKRILDVLESGIVEFMNGRKWSSDVIKPQERIDCNLVINITEWDGSSPNFKAEAQIQVSRPVYNSSYNSTLLNLSDPFFDFYYIEGQAIDFSDQNYISNLSSLLAFYANIAVGLDCDSFSKLSGNPYFAKAQNILNNAQNSPNAGWKAFEGLRNRFWLIENLNNKSFIPLREAFYVYHRNGLDEMSDNPAKARQTIAQLLPELEKLDQQKQGAMLTQLFFTAKADELINILKNANTPDKMRAAQILMKLDPTNAAKYESLKK
ncbi:MAG: hypothetical protein RLZ47_333 [Bacteroidota bacterium]